MAANFRKGQLVAVRDGDKDLWRLRVYDHEWKGLFFCIDLARITFWSDWWEQACPAEQIWPDIFLGHDRDIIDSCRQCLSLEKRVNKALWAVAEQVDRMVAWLCQQLQAIGDRNGSQECPPSPFHNCRTGDCATCWRQAAEQVVEGAQPKAEGDSDG